MFLSKGNGTNLVIPKLFITPHLNYGVRTIAREKNCPPVRVRVWVRVRVRVEVGGNFPRGQLS